MMRQYGRTYTPKYKAKRTELEDARARQWFLARKRRDSDVDEKASQASLGKTQPVLKPGPHHLELHGGKGAMDEKRLAEIEAREQAATPKPWRADWKGTNHFELQSSAPGMFWLMLPDRGLERGEDLDFVAHARQDVPDLVAEVRRLRRIITMRASRIVSGQGDVLDEAQMMLRNMDHPPPQLEDIGPINITGGLSSEEHVRRMRDGE